MRLLFVHAHPDDESLATGVAIAHHVAAGDDVHVLTCTLGEQGEVIPPELAHLAAEADDTLGEYRRGELRAAMAAIGARHEVLGADPATGRLSRWRDSGMAGAPSAADPRAWVNADREEAVAAVTAVITRIDPDVVVSYDAAGGYEHPDHIRTHEVTCAAVARLADQAGTPAAFADAERAGSPAPTVPQLWGVFTPIEWAREDRRWLAAHAQDVARLGWTLPDPDGPYPASVVDDVDLLRLEDRAAVAGQVAALHAHRTQVTVADTPDGPGYALSNGIAARLPGREAFAQLDPRTGAPLPRSRWSADRGLGR